jgi:hypothetical protein
VKTSLPATPTLPHPFGRTKSDRRNLCAGLKSSIRLNRIFYANLLKTSRFLNLHRSMFPART